MFLPTSVHRQITPAINNTQIRSCLTVDVEGVCSWFPPMFLPTSVHRQITPAINNTQIRSCLTVEFNRVSSFSGLTHPIGATTRHPCEGMITKPAPQTAPPSINVRRLDVPIGSRTSPAFGSGSGFGVPPKLRFYSARTKFRTKPQTN